MITPIIIIILLVSPLAIAYFIGLVKGTVLEVRKYALWGLGATFLFFSIGHFVKTDEMIQMLPVWVPFRLAVVYVTGVIELFISIALFTPRFQNNAALIAVCVFVLFFPANVYSAINANDFGGYQWGPIYLLVRTPLQLCLIAWAYLLCLDSNKWPRLTNKLNTKLRKNNPVSL